MIATKGASRMKAAPAAVIGYFSERSVIPALRESFACVWVHQMAEAGAPPVIVAPDGAIDLQSLGGTFRIAGPDKEAQIDSIPAGSAASGLGCRPRAAAAWIGPPASEMLGPRVSL